jgi:sortase A
MTHKIKRLMAYIYMPLIFTLLGYSFAYIALTPVLEMLQAVGSMVIAQETPDFSTGLKSIYNSSKKETSLNPSSDNEITEETSELQDIVSINEIEFPDYETKYATITCKHIGMEAPVYWGDTRAVLKSGVGNYIGGYMPGFGKPILISGHNTSFFKPLQNIEVGDIITYDTNYGTFEYQVSEISVLYVTEATTTTKQLLSLNEEKLIMYTCYPFETLVGTKMDRLFVFADKISGPTIE